MKAKTVILNLLSILLVVVPVAFMAILGTLFFVGLGALLAWLSPLTLFQSICVTIGSALTMTVVAYVVKIGEARRAWNTESDADDDDWIDADEDDAEAEGEDDQEAKGVGIDVSSELHQTPKIGRNLPCPCGSGKKYKNCCGKDIRFESRL